MAKVTVLFFGATADAVGSRQLEMDIPDNKTVAGLTESLIAKNPRLGQQRLLFAVNEEHADPQAILSEGDQVAVFTPVSGG